MVVEERESTRTRPFGLLRVGFQYEKTLGMRRLTNTPVSVVLADDGDLLILCRGEGLCFVRRLSYEDDDKGAFNIVGGGGPVGGGFKVDGGFVWPACMIRDAEERLWISDEGAHTVSALTAGGEALTQWGTHGSGPGEMDRPSGIAFDSDGNILVADAWNHRVQKFTQDGAFVSAWGTHGQGSGQFDMPWGICVDEQDYVYVCDWQNDRVQKLDSDGRHVMTIGEKGSADGQFNRPTGVTVDRDGDVYVADWANHRVQVFNSDGLFVEKFIGDATLSRQAREYMITNMVAMRLREMTAIEPQKRFRWPVSVTVVDDGRMFVPDYGSQRIQVYRKDVIRLGPGEIAPKPRSHSLYTQF